MVRTEKIKVNVLVQQDGDWYVAKCLENSVASQGKTIEEAIANLKEALALYFENEQVDFEDKPSFLTTLEVAI